MKRIFFIFTIFISIITPALSQTKLIAHKSHSGKTTTFRTSMKADSSDQDFSNYGLPPKRYFSKIDSVKYISDSISIVVSRLSIIHQDRVSFEFDTIHNHPLFKQGMSTVNLKKALEELDYETSDSIDFIGFDKISNVSKKTKKNYTPLLIFDNSNPPFNPKWIGIVSIFFIALVIAFLSKKYSTMKRLLNER
ncbi:hypothetical protein [Sporocytophaga myxococcoides]|uniref:hypothetical protein n=1 Tax=Sporocytophaga myxococcoides TaxID=153721 RepID=UPI0003FB6319|nr:hypothetical protein [Sporocytophaga myxococcoides]